MMSAIEYVRRQVMGRLVADSKPVFAACLRPRLELRGGEKNASKGLPSPISIMDVDVRMFSKCKCATCIAFNIKQELQLFQRQIARRRRFNLRIKNPRKLRRMQRSLAKKNQTIGLSPRG